MGMHIAKLTIIKWFWSFEKEEAWLEGMAGQGWLLEKVTSLGAYTFHKGPATPVTYKIDFRHFTQTQDRVDYLALFEDAGWSCAAANPSIYSYYFYSNQGDGHPDIFSDRASRAQRYHRYAGYMGLSIFPAFVPILTLYLTGVIHPGDIGYQTPGLWQMTGMRFVSHFLFETPFVLLRAWGYLLPLIPIGLGIYFYLKYAHHYRRVLAEEEA